MTTMFDISIYDPMKHLKRLKKAGLVDTLAEIHVEETEKAIHAVSQYIKEDLHEKKHATKSDLKEVKHELKTEISEVKTEIKELKTEIKVLDRRVGTLETKIEYSKNQILIWTFSMLIIFASLILGVMARGFGWLH
ncbi:MAG: DUF1640 domain-containing protein [Candidatus Margulisbacteria bacterium]|nr:DUF1640 domain-containing protein [Candidatus Margulisiibacteriota bacterium]